MGFDYINPGISEELVTAATTPAPKKEKVERTVAPEGYYTMELRNIRGKLSAAGAPYVEIFARHADKENFGFTGATLKLFRTKEDVNVNTEATNRTLVQIGKALDLSAEEIGLVNFAVDTSAEASDFGELPATLLMGEGAEIALEGLTIKAKVVVDEWNGKLKNVITSIYAIGS